MFFLFKVFDKLYMFDTFRAVMKKPTTKKPKSKPSHAGEPVVPPAVIPQPQAATISEEYPIQIEGPNGGLIAMPRPEALLMEAEQELNCNDFSAYSEVIRTLRNKRFSYREIAEWLTERGVPVDHNAVYRIYTKSLTDFDAAMEAAEVDREEEEEARNNS